MHTDPTSDNVRQPQSSPTVHPWVDVRSQPSTFSLDMSNEQLAQWLRDHPSLTGANYEEDISKLIGKYHHNYYIHDCTGNYIVYYYYNMNYYCRWRRCQDQWQWISESRRRQTGATWSVIRIPLTISEYHSGLGMLVTDL